MDVGSHVVDSLVGLFGHPDVQAYEDDALRDGVEANCRLRLAFGRVRGLVQLSWSQPLASGLHVLGSDGELESGAQLVAHSAERLCGGTAASGQRWPRWATEVFILGVAVRGVPAGTFERETGRVAGRAAAVGVLLAGFLLGGRAVGAPWLVTAMLGGLGYLAVVIRLGIMPRDVLGWVRGLLSRRRSRRGPPVSSAAA
jgi:hypothetical protein